MNERLAIRAVFAAGLLLGAAPVFAPAPKTEFDVAGFARLPVLEGGRVKPLDSFARNALLLIRGKSSALVDGKRVGATQWLLDAAYKPALADTYPIFVIATVAMSYEIIEWIYAANSDPAAGAAYLGSQGDIWDAQKDMLADILGALVATLIFFAFNNTRAKRS